MPYSRSAIVLLLSLLAAGCGGRSEAPTAAAAPDVPAVGKASQPYGLPAPNELRAAAITMSTEVDGSANYSHSTNTVQVGSTLVLNSTAHETSWAIYGFNLGLAYLEEVEVVLTVSGPSEAYLGIGYFFGVDTWEFSGPYTGTQSVSFTQKFHRGSGGTYFVAVLTTGGDSATVLKLNATIENGWAIVTVDDSLAPGVEAWGTSLKIVDFRPAIAYYDTGAQDLNYAYSSDSPGLAAEDWSVVAVDQTGDLGKSPSLQLIEGQPAISYADASGDSLKYARRVGDPTDWEIETVDGGTSLYTSLAVIDGNPAIAYFDFDNGNLKYARASNTTGTGPGLFWTIATADNSLNTVGLYASMIEIDSRPAIAYYDSSDLDLRYAICDNALGLLPDQWERFAVQTAGVLGVTPHLFMYAAMPRISYLDISNKRLLLVSSSTPTGEQPADWGGPQVLDSTGNNGRYCSFAMIDGYPAFAYYDDDGRDLKFAWAAEDTLGGDWWYATVDSEGSVGSWCSLTEVLSRPAISYINQTDGELRYAYYYTFHSAGE